MKKFHHGYVSLACCRWLFLISIAISFHPAASTAQVPNIYGDIVEEMAKEGAAEVESLMRDAPKMLGDAIDRSGEFEEFETEVECLATLQAIVNLGVIVANTMPFSKVWTLEDGRGPVAIIRVMLNGNKLSVEANCDGAKLVVKPVDWGSGSSKRVERVNGTLNAAIGAVIIGQQLGAFDEQAPIATANGAGQVSEESILQSQADAERNQEFIDSLKRQREIEEMAELEFLEMTIVEQMSELQKDLESQASLCWNPPLVVADISIEVRIELDGDGRVIAAPTLLESSGGSSRQIELVFQSVRRALFRCGPFVLDKKYAELGRVVDLEFSRSQ